jgi:hypothetical protein
MGVRWGALARSAAGHAAMSCGEIGLMTSSQGLPVRTAEAGARECYRSASRQSPWGIRQSPGAVAASRNHRDIWLLAARLGSNWQTSTVAPNFKHMRMIWLVSSIAWQHEKCFAKRPDVAKPVSTSPCT